MQRTFSLAVIWLIAGAIACVVLAWLMSTFACEPRGILKLAWLFALARSWFLPVAAIAIVASIFTARSQSATWLRDGISFAAFALVTATLGMALVAIGMPPAPCG